MECKICFCEVETELGYQCKICDAIVCKDCFTRLLDFCKTEKMLISCVLCKREVLYQNVELEYKRKYNELCVNYLLNRNNIKNKIEENKSKEKFYKQIQKEREDFVKTMPNGIKLLIQIALSKKIKKIKKDNIKYIETKKRKCMREICKGFLYELHNNFECDLCKIKYCKKCESKINEKESQTHICKKEELESLEEIEKYVKCPNCILPVVKSEGCNNITCSICKTNFCYRTGEIINDGNHDYRVLKLKEYKLSGKIIEENKYSKEIIMMIIEIESNEPKKSNIIDVIKNIKEIDIDKLKQSKTGNSLINTISKKYSKYREHKEEYEIYYKKLLDIDMYNEKKMQENDMKNVLIDILNHIRKNNHFDTNSLIPKDSEEYTLIEEKIKKEGCCEILYMEKLKNNKLEKQFIEYKINIKDKEKFELKMLYHGTGEDNVEMILKDGFNTKYNITSAYGTGTYLSDSFKYSEGYTKVSTKRNKNIIICECIVKNENLKTKNIYCFKDSSQIIPRVLVVFK